MEKLKFMFQLKQPLQNHYNCISIISITTEDNKTFLMPEELQPAKLHTTISTSGSNRRFIKSIKNTLKKLHQKKSVWIKLTDKMKQTYFDEAGKMVFKNQYLEEINLEKEPPKRKGKKNVSWYATMYAMSFKYETGSLLQYVIKKEKLLLEMRKTMDAGSLVDIIAAGLPDFITDRINRQELLETKDLLNKIIELEKSDIKLDMIQNQDCESCQFETKHILNVEELKNEELNDNTSLKNY